MDAKVCRLVALGPGGTLGVDLELTSCYMTLGRSHSNDLVLSEPSVSRVHASLRVDHDGHVSVQDLGSSAGTTVNGRPAAGQVMLRSGDVVAFGGARSQYQGPPDKAAATAVLPVQRAPRPQPREVDVQGQYEIENQHAGNISNVAGHQYTAYVSHVRQERESFLQAVAATRTKARWLIWIGAILTIVGLVIAGGTFYQIFTGSFTTDINVFRELGGVYILAGFAAAGGQILIIIGIVVHVVATSRRKRVDPELPLPPRPRSY